MQRLGELLVIEHVLTPAARDAALERAFGTGERIGSTAIDGGANADRIAMVLARQRGVLAALDRQLSAVPAAVASLLPEETARRLCAVPLRLAAGTGELVVAVRDPGDPAVFSELTQVTGKTVRIAVAAERRLHQALDVVYGGATADNPLVQRAPAVSKPPPEAARLLAEMGAASTRAAGTGRLWRRLIERALVVLLVVSLIGAYAKQRRRAASSAPRPQATQPAPDEPAGQLAPAVGDYREALARCKKKHDTCLLECRRNLNAELLTPCSERCAGLCAHMWTFAPDKGAR